MAQSNGTKRERKGWASSENTANEFERLSHNLMEKRSRVE